MCGEASGHGGGLWYRRGLSPRVRGSRLQSRMPALPLGIIPACAGKPGGDLGQRLRAEDYPRVCGEALGMLSRRERALGLSPRVRGSHRPQGDNLMSIRIIPACAGKPSARMLSASVSWDYPRVCGEASTILRRGSAAQGLSPRVRGSRRAGWLASIALGIIPACAGKPGGDLGQRLRAEDYPRVCGEAVAGASRLRIAMGLSPRVRGSPVRGVRQRVAGGIIPACAGKPAGIRARRPLPWDYPRVCGEAVYVIYATGLQQGLSPRVRGSRWRIALVAVMPRIIPACAGKPVVLGCGHAHARDYPRVCGEARSVTTDTRSAWGLSPRVRGSPARMRPGVVQPGIIPACAGKPPSWG